MVVLRGQTETLSVPRQPCNDAAMFLGESRRFERPAELFPFLPRILRKTSPLSVRQAVHICRQGTDGLLDAFIGRRQFELRVERFQMSAEFFAERQNEIRLGGGRVGHGEE